MIGKRANRAPRIQHPNAFKKAETEIVGKAVVLTDGKAGTVEKVWLDELHDLRISIKGHDGKWPVSTIKNAQEPDRLRGRHPVSALAN